MTGDKFCLRWNDFEQSVSRSFVDFRDENDFLDVTLACEEEQIQAHKVILSACSSFFKNILKRNQHQHPLLYLKGIKYSDLASILTFMYLGEVNVAQENLTNFLSVAEDLQVKAKILTGFLEIIRHLFWLKCYNSKLVKLNLILLFNHTHN